MKKNAGQFCWSRYAGVWMLTCAFASPALASNTWTNLASGLWRDTNNWSSHKAPDASSGAILITTNTSKVITIDSLTPSNNLTINNLTLSAPENSTNTLALSDVGTNAPLVLLTTSDTLSLRKGGALTVTHSALVITGSFLSFNLWAGSALLESGSIVVRDQPARTNTTVFTRIGRTNAASLTINGGTMEASALLIGESPGSQFPRSDGTVTINGGTLRILSDLSIGDAPTCTGTVAVAGGQLLVANNLTNVIRIGNYGLGQMTVSNASVTLPTVSVARHDGAHGVLTLQSNGIMMALDDLSIGRFSGATGAVFVSGGQLLATNQPIWIGREGVGQMTVSNGAVQALSLLVAAVPTNTARGTFTMLGGSFNLSSNLVLGDASISTGQVVIAGGDLSINNANNSGMLTIPSGTFDLSGGNVTADNILLTNSAGRLIFNSGTLHSRNTSVSNAMPFVIGDGTNAATFQLLGGTHYFADGLIISSNATLSGCGTIIGTIINQGTIATNCAAVPPSITQQPVSLIVTQGATAMFSVVAAGDPPLHYQWRFSGLMANIPGATNSTLMISDAQTTNAGNYRVIVSNASGSIMSVIATLRVLIPSTIVSTTLLGTNFDFSFSTVSNLNYTIEYKTNLSDAIWTPLSTVTGTGALFPFSDAVTAVTNRFFRLRVE